MKLFEILEEGEWSGDIALQNTQQYRNDRGQRDASSFTKGVWIIDRNTGKKLAGPFKDNDAARTFKANRGDRIPPDALLRDL